MIVSSCVARSTISRTAYFAHSILLLPCIASFIEPYRDLLWGMRWLLTPAILVVMALVIANAISITVRERRTETAVMKVLGFQPRRSFADSLGELAEWVRLQRAEDRVQDAKRELEQRGLVA